MPRKLSLKLLRNSVLAALLAVALIVVCAGTAEACRRSDVRTAVFVSTQEQCDLRVSVDFVVSRGKTTIRSVYADGGMDGLRSNFSLVLSEDGKTLYAGPGPGVGDGRDYLWTSGWEPNADGKSVRIGASTVSPQGWPRAGFTGTKLAGFVSAQPTYCTLRFTLP